MVWLCPGCSVATFISSRGESRRDFWASFCPSWMVGVALSVSDGSDIRLVGHCKGKSHGPRFYRLWQMFTSVGKKQSVWESMHGKLEVTKDKIKVSA